MRSEKELRIYLHALEGIRPIDRGYGDGRLAGAIDALRWAIKEPSKRINKRAKAPKAKEKRA